MSYIFANVWDIDRTNKFVDWFYSPDFVFGIAKYAVCILTGILLAFFICTKEGERMGIKREKVLTAATIIVPLCILGARLWYLIGDGVNSFKYYKTYEGGNGFKAILDLLGMFIGFSPETNWSYEGISGLAIHGGVAIAIVGLIVVSKIFKWDAWCVADMVAPGLLIGQICGRWGNFFNQEAHGTIIGGWTANEAGQLIPNIDDPAQQYSILCKFVPKFIAKNMYLPASEKYYYGIVNGEQSYGYIHGSFDHYFFHPTFLYELLGNSVGLILYFILRRQKWAKSGIFGPLYLIWYGIVRFFIEIIRTDSLYIPGTTLKMAQLTSILMIVAGIILLIINRFVRKAPTYKNVIEEKKGSK